MVTKSVKSAELLILLISVLSYFLETLKALGTNRHAHVGVTSRIAIQVVPWLITAEPPDVASSQTQIVQGAWPTWADSADFVFDAAVAYHWKAGVGKMANVFSLQEHFCTPRLSCSPCSILENKRKGLRMLFSLSFCCAQHLALAGLATSLLLGML